MVLVSRLTTGFILTWFGNVSFESESIAKKKSCIAEVTR